MVSLTSLPAGQNILFLPCNPSLSVLSVVASLCPLSPPFVSSSFPLNLEMWHYSRWAWGLLVFPVFTTMTNKDSPVSFNLYSDASKVRPLKPNHSVGFQSLISRWLFNIFTWIIYNLPMFTKAFIKAKMKFLIITSLCCIFSSPCLRQQRCTPPLLGLTI